MVGAVDIEKGAKKVSAWRFVEKARRKEKEETTHA